MGVDSNAYVLVGLKLEAGSRYKKIIKTQEIPDVRCEHLKGTTASESIKFCQTCGAKAWPISRQITQKTRVDLVETLQQRVPDLITSVFESTEQIADCDVEDYTIIAVSSTVRSGPRSFDCHDSKKIRLTLEELIVLRELLREELRQMDVWPSPVFDVNFDQRWGIWNEMSISY